MPISATLGKRSRTPTSTKSDEASRPTRRLVSGGGSPFVLLLSVRILAGCGDSEAGSGVYQKGKDRMSTANIFLTVLPRSQLVTEGVKSKQRKRR